MSVATISMPHEPVRSESRFDHFAALHRLADGLQELARAAEFQAETIRLVAASVDRDGPPAPDVILDGVRGGLAGAYELLVQPYLKEARRSAIGLRMNGADSDRDGGAL